MNETVYPLLSRGFLRSYLITMRPYLLFISGTAGIVGLAFIEEPSIIRVILAFIPLFLSYGLGQALTDCFQIDTDAISAPYRPLVRGIISRKQVLSVSLTGLAVGILIMAYLNPKILIFGILSVIGLLTYTSFKRTWWGGPPWNSWIVALLPIMGRLVDREYQIKTIIRFGDSYSLAFFLSIIAIFFGYANFVVMGYFKDISADRRTGYRTFPVVFGWKPAAIYSDLTAMVVAVLTGSVLLLTGNLNIWGIAIFVIAVAVNLYAQIKIHRTRDESKTHGPIGNVVRAFVLYCMAITVTLKPKWLIFIAVFYLLFELTLRLRPEKSQV
ncbi:UbiA family prenyltransferase [candidate division WOR-3 bacterium]|nr:UbiA family prenyltransferase [candidate division WOR-3 bacterium]